MKEFTARVRYSELSEDKKLSLVALINYFQDLSNFESEDNGVGLKWLNERGTAWMLTSWQIKINGRPMLGDEITAKTWACGFKKFIGVRNFTLCNDKGEELAYALSNWAYIDVVNNCPAEVPDEEIKAYGFMEPLERDFAKGRIKIPAELETRESITIRKFNIDTNHHVNNGQYIALAEEMLPAGFITTGLRADYKSQTVQGEVIIPKVGISGDKYIVVLDSDTGDRKLVAEFEGYVNK